EAALVAELIAAHGAHTIILYGSRARGDATEESDIDVAAFADVERTTRDARRWNGFYLDAFVYPTAIASAPADDEMLKFRGARVLLDDRDLARAFLASVHDHDARGPLPITADERQMRVVWSHKMLERIRRGDIEAHYRAHWLLFQLLEDHYALGGRWYRGPKEAFATMRTDEPALFALFEQALAPGAPVDAIAALVAAVARAS
ncbi:MAG TPA: nucleotidyltransferase domain-containing protein, partial [Kofleriaceae bacterium]